MPEIANCQDQVHYLLLFVCIIDDNDYDRMYTFVSGNAESDNATHCNVNVMWCPSVSLLHHAKAVGWNEMPFGRDTCVDPSNIVLDRSPGPPREGEIFCAGN